jgi:hypothetical protein
MKKNLVFFGHLKGEFTDKSFDLHLKLLKRYSSLFDHQVIYLSFDDPERVNMNWCRDLFRFFENPVIEIVKNDPTNRESFYFMDQINSLSSTESTMTFYCHSKGITQNGDPQWLEHWVFSMYHFNLHPVYVDDTENAISRGKIFGGALRKNVACPPWVEAPWHYSGTFYWFNTLEVLNRKNNYHRVDRMSTESFPGEVSTLDESFCTPGLDFNYNFDARYDQFWIMLFHHLTPEMKLLYDFEFQRITNRAIVYEPLTRDTPNLMTKMASAWGDIPTILKDIIDRFSLKTNKAIEFGVEFGYSTSAISNYFDRVIGVDTFLGDLHAGFREDHYEMTKSNLSSFRNIELVQSTYQDYIKDHEEFFDLVHIDIVHTYDHTYACGEWAVNRSKITLFHDTELFEDVKRACSDLAEKYDLEFYNYPFSHGLGILHNTRL